MVQAAFGSDLDCMANRARRPRHLRQPNAKVSRAESLRDEPLGRVRGVSASSTRLATASQVLHTVVLAIGASLTWASADSDWDQPGPVHLFLCLGRMQPECGRRPPWAQHSSMGKPDTKAGYVNRARRVFRAHSRPSGAIGRLPIKQRWLACCTEVNHGKERV